MSVIKPLFVHRRWSNVVGACHKVPKLAAADVHEQLEAMLKIISDTGLLPQGPLDFKAPRFNPTMPLPCLAYCSETVTRLLVVQSRTSQKTFARISQLLLRAHCKNSPVPCVTFCYAGLPRVTAGSVAGTVFVSLYKQWFYCCKCAASTEMIIRPVY